MSFFAAYALIGGVAAIVAVLSRETRADRPWGLLLVEGIFGIAVAVMWVTKGRNVSLRPCGAAPAGTSCPTEREVSFQVVFAVLMVLGPPCIPALRPPGRVCPFVRIPPSPPMTEGRLSKSSIGVGRRLPKYASQDVGFVH